MNLFGFDLFLWFICMMDFIVIVDFGWVVVDDFVDRNVFFFVNYGVVCVGLDLLMVVVIVVLFEWVCE